MLRTFKPDAKVLRIFTASTEREIVRRDAFLNGNVTRSPPAVDLNEVLLEMADASKVAKFMHAEYEAATLYIYTQARISWQRVPEHAGHRKLPLRSSSTHDQRVQEGCNVASQPPPSQQLPHPDQSKTGQRGRKRQGSHIRSWERGRRHTARRHVVVQINHQRVQCTRKAKWYDASKRVWEGIKVVTSSCHVPRKLTAHNANRMWKDLPNSPGAASHTDRRMQTSHTG